MGEGRGPRRSFRPAPWTPAAAAVVAMLGLLAFAVVTLRPSGTDLRGTPAAPPPATPPFLAGPAPPAEPRPSPPAGPIRTAATRPPAPDLVGRYAVVDSFPDSFIGEVRVTNTSDAPRSWTVRLRFPAGVGGLRAFWVERAPRPDVQRSGAVFTFTSGAPVPPGGAAWLRFQFDRDGSGTTPSTCAVNGASCTGVSAT